MSDLSDQPDPPAERRKSMRYACVLEALWLDGGRRVYRPSWPARLLDVSRDGVGIHVAEEYPIGTLLAVELRDERSGSRGHFDLRIVRASRQPNGTWVLGATFLQPLTEEQLQALLA